MKQRLLVARALVNSRDPVHGRADARLDPTSAREFAHAGGAPGDGGTTVFLTTITWKRRRALRSRRLPQPGRIVALDTPRELKLKQATTRGGA